MPSPLPNQTTSGLITPGKQYGFFFDQGRCVACQSCMLACEEWNGLPMGAAARWMKVYVWEKGTWPNTNLRTLALPCYHCENPVCVDAANGAMYKEPKYGAVLIDPAKAAAQSEDLRKANQACPYHVIVFDSDAAGAKGSKCTMCIDRLEQGMSPICVMACDLRAFDFGPLSDLQQKYGTLRQLDEMPDPSIAQPAVSLKAQLPRKQVVPYDVNKVLTLWQQRGPYAQPDSPPVFQSPTEVTNPPELRIRNKLVLNWKTNDELLYLTRHDE
jgi:anaerobic dimethyl sulfoxide reductase subunit B